MDRFFKEKAEVIKALLRNYGTIELVENADIALRVISSAQVKNTIDNEFEQVKIVIDKESNGDEELKKYYFNVFYNDHLLR